MKNSYLFLSVILLFVLVIGCQKIKNDFAEKHESDDISKSVSFTDFIKSIKTTDNLILKAKIKNKEVSFSSLVLEESFTIDSTSIKVINSPNNSITFSMILRPKTYFAANCFFNLYVKVDSLGNLTQTIAKLTPTAATRNNGKKNFVGNYEILQNNQINNFSNSNSMCDILQVTIPCDNGIVHSQNGPGSWCDAQGSYNYSITLSCSGGGGTGGAAGAGVGTIGINPMSPLNGGSGGDGTNNNGTIGGGIITVPSNILDIDQCVNPPTNQFIFQTYNSNTTWINQHLSEFNQLTATLCNDFTQEQKEFVNWAIDYLMQNPNISFETFKNRFMGIKEGLDGTFDSVYWNNPNTVFVKIPLPTFTKFFAAFPKLINPISGIINPMGADSVYRLISGDLGAKFGQIYYTNACAIRCSWALNNIYDSSTNSYPFRIPIGTNNTENGANNLMYILSAKGFNLYMHKKFTAPPAYSITKSQISGNIINLNNFLDSLKANNVNGIYSLVLENGSPYSGHADILINGESLGGFALPNIITKIEKIEIWKLN